MEGNGERVRALIRQLIDAETELQEILGVEVDAVLDPSSGTPLLLRRAQAEMHLLLRQLPAVVWSTDGQLRLTSALGAGLEMLDVVPGQVLGASLVDEALPGLGGRRAIGAHLEALQGRPAAFEFEFRERTFQAHVEPLLGSRGQIDGCLGMALDITDRARAEAALRQLRDELEIRVEDQTAELESAAAELTVHNDDLLVTHQALEAERQRYRDLFEFAPDGYVVTDLFGTIQGANQAACRLLAGEPGHLVGRSLIFFVAEAGRQALLENLQALQAGWQTQAVLWQMRFEPRGGRAFDAAVTVAPVAPPAGQPAGEAETAGLRWLIRDESERRQAEEDKNAALAAARTSAERLRLVADFTYDWEYWTAPGGETVYVSPSVERITGYGPAEFLAEPRFFLRLVHPDDLAAVIEHHRRKKEEPGTHELQYRIVTRQGEERWIDHVCQPVYGDDGQLLGWRGSNRDVTAGKLAELERDRLLNRSQALVRLSEEILAEQSLPGLLQRIVDAACALTGARMGVAGHGYRDGRFVVGASSRAPERSACPPGEMFAVERGGVYLSLIEQAGSLRLGREALAAHPAWWGLPAGHAPLSGLLAVSLLGRDGRPNGMIMVSDRSEGEFTADDEAALRQLAALASLAVQHVEARMAAEARAAELAAANEELLAARETLQQQNEEIQVTEEELRQQNEELRATHGAVEAQRQRYLELFESAPDGYVVTDQRGTVQAANRAAVELLGVETRFLVGKPLAGYVAAPDRATFYGGLQALHDGEPGPWHGDVRLRPRNGRPFDAALTVAPSRPAGAGTEASLRWLIRDVSAHKQAVAERERLLVQAQEARTRSEEQAALLDAVVAAIADGLVLYDAEGRITRSNAAAEALLHDLAAERDVPLAERIGRRQPVDGQGRPLPAEQAPASRALRGETVQGETMGLRPAGQRDEPIRWLSVSAGPVRDARGRRLGAVATFRDITGVRQAQAELERRVEERTAELRQTVEALRASEERYRTVSELTSDYIYRLDVDAGAQMVGTLVTAGFQRLTGFDLDEVKDMANWRKFLHPDDLARTVEFFGAVMASRRPAITEVRMLTRDGEMLWTEFLARPVWDEGEGRVTAIEGAVKDITERHRMQDTLRESEQRFRDLAENIDEVFWLLEAEGNRLLYVSPAYERVWGRPVQAAYDRPAGPIDGVHPDDRERVLAAWQARRDEYDEEFRIVRPDGSQRWLRTRTYPVEGGPGVVARLAGVTEDVTEEKQAQAALLRAERLGMAGRLAASLAHEINNPLQSAVGCLDLAREALAAGEDPGRFLDVVSAALQRAAGVVAQLRALHRETRAEEKHPVHLAALVEQLLVLTRKRCYSAGVEVMCDLSPDLPPLRVQRDTINQVFLNLVLNAVDAMPEGGVLRISSQATAEPEGAWIWFADSGGGLSPDMETHLFEPFHSTKREGLGLGLFISNNIVQQHRGRIVAEARAEGGTVFGVWLPV